LNEVEQVATRMAIINKGKMIVQGSVDELLRAKEQKTLFSVEPRKKAFVVMQKIRDIHEPVETDEGIMARIDAKKIPAVVAELVKQRCKVYSVEPKRSLEEYFLTITESGE
jgi:ABC-type multidrug transport system ATPase subunit